MQKYSVFFLTAMSMVLIAVFSVRCSGVEQDGVAGTSQMPKVVTGAAGSLLKPAKPLPAFSLVDHRGEEFGPAQLAGRWSLLFMGFTSCGHLCPPTMYKMTLVQEQLGELVPELPLRILFVSVDPGRDNQLALMDYAEGYGPDVLAVTGPAAELDALAGGLGATWRVIKDDESYVVEHSPALYLINPEGRFAGIFSPPLNSEKIAADIQGYIGSE